MRLQAAARHRGHTEAAIAAATAVSAALEAAKRTAAKPPAPVAVRQKRRNGAERRKNRGLTGDAAALLRIQNREEAEARVAEKRRRLTAEWEAQQVFFERRLAETRRKERAVEEAAAAAVWAPVAPFLPGEAVMMQGLKKRLDLNGMCGTLLVFNEAIGRWSMAVDALKTTCFVPERNIRRAVL